MRNNDYIDYEDVTSAYNPVFVQAAFSKLMRKVYSWMTLALVVTGLTALYVSGNAEMMAGIMTGSAFWILAVAEIALVLMISAGINRLSFMTAGLLFILYSILNGVTMSFIFLAYTHSSIATAFFVTAGTFGVMSLVGYFTKKDLSGFGKIMFMALIGLIIASVVNMFLKNPAIYWITSYIGVAIFVGLTAYDTQKIKHMFLAYGNDVNEQTQKMALLGSLTLYLDFINLFLYLLRIFGGNRNN